MLSSDKTSFFGLCWGRCLKQHLLTMKLSPALPILGVTNPWLFSDPLSDFNISLRHSTVCTPFFHFQLPDTLIFHRQLPTLFLISYSFLPAYSFFFFFNSFPINITEVFLLVFISVLLAVESMHVILWMFLFKICGVVDACVCELCSCIHAGIYTAEVQEQKAPQQFV